MNSMFSREEDNQGSHGAPREMFGMPMDVAGAEALAQRAGVSLNAASDGVELPAQEAASSVPVVDEDETSTGIVEAPRRKRRSLLRPLLGALGIAGSLAAVGYGANLATTGDNWEDFSDLRAFTSADHQSDRCDVQAAYDAQGKMNVHFEGKGGVTPEEAQLMGPVVGLEPAEVEELIETKLFEIGYDCDVPVASSAEATTGLLVATAGGALLMGGLAGAALRRREA